MGQKDRGEWERKRETLGSSVTRQACPLLACQLWNRVPTIVTCSVSAIVRRSKRGLQSRRDNGLHDGRTSGQHDAPTPWRPHLPQPVPLSSRILWPSLIKLNA
ncbi:hypothetical protein PV325_001437 [Microctonus aethiopoides]|uniref:Uncharacterized protein n=2 Tax=Microctonus TaxID=144405 RepID=A0AA39G6S9_MICHY|nr:hypothetical protein PV325_001437 [Microctonus aethiopoides]KAK0164073.1 hypothetical protein PV328_002741 [Microctonus aethiopoides]KAK0182135.1 hypothetical protein PV327_000301 [Microctonus hyperodae]